MTADGGHPALTPAHVGLTAALVGPEGTVAFHVGNSAGDAVMWHFDLHGVMTKVEVGTLTLEAYLTAIRAGARPTYVLLPARCVTRKGTQGATSAVRVPHGREVPTTR